MVLAASAAEHPLGLPPGAAHDRHGGHGVPSRLLSWKKP